MERDKGRYSERKSATGRAIEVDTVREREYNREL